jgi:hypothetical protein
MTNLRHRADGAASLIGEDDGVLAFGPGDTSDCGSDWQGSFGFGDASVFDEINDFEESIDTIDAADEVISGESADEFAARIDGA